MKRFGSNLKALLLGLLGTLCKKLLTFSCAMLPKDQTLFKSMIAFATMFVRPFCLSDHFRVLWIKEINGFIAPWYFC